MLANQNIRVRNRRIGSFEFDTTTAEAHDSSLIVTENPIETGESIADHAYSAPKTVTISGVVVAYEPPKQWSILQDAALSFVREFPLPVEIKAVTDQAIKYAARFISVSSQAQSQARTIAPYLPNFKNAGLDSSPSLLRTGRAYSDLIALQQSGELLEIVTGTYIYKDMAIASISQAQTNDNAAEFTLTLREVAIVETRTEGGLIFEDKAQGRSGEGAAGVENHGRTQPEEKDQSVLGRIFN